MKIAIVGAGWYGCHIALELKKNGYEVYLYEKSSDILSGISGNFGIRLHRGPHYPRSQKTREICSDNFYTFLKLYPELILEHEKSIYALGIKDAQGYPPKVSLKQFSEVCEEVDSAKKIENESFDVKEVQTAYNVYEP